MKPRDTTAISQVAILVILGLAAGFFLLGGYFPAKKETRKLEPPPAVELGEKSATSASVSTSQMNTSATLPISGSQQPVVRSDEEGTRLNLQAYELIQQKNYQQAEPVLRRAVQSFPPGTTAVAYKYALYNLGHVLRRTGRAKEAIPFLEKCVQIDPQWSKAQSELATARAETQSSAVTQISQNTVRQQP